MSAGALVLVVLSVGFTVYLLNRPAPTPAPTATIASGESAASNPSISAPPMAAPANTSPPTTPAQTTSMAVAPIVAATAERKSVTPSVTVQRSSEAEKSLAVATAPLPAPPHVEPAMAPSTTPPPSLADAPPKVDEGIYQYVDALRVTGVKAAGNDSRVLMNDRVYRVNDIVERNLGVRLIKVETNTLTFSDANGAIYVKNF
jgi:hypothetical protein